jgi:hypothetical protein
MTMEFEPPVATLNGLNGTQGASGITHCTIFETSWHEWLFLLTWWLDRVLAGTAAALRVYRDADPATPALTFGVTPGEFTDGTTPVAYAGSAGNALTDNAMNYVYLTSAGVLTVNTTGFPAPGGAAHVPLATIVTSGGDWNVATAITDHRSRAIYKTI